VDRTTAQLAVLREIDALLRNAHIRSWLRGGWALDFLVGRVTREHDDIDLITWRRHERRLRQLFEENGFGVTRHRPGTQIDFEKRGQEVQVALVLKWGGFVWTHPFVGQGFQPNCAEADLRGPLARLGDIRCRVVSARALLAEMEFFGDVRKLPPRQKDAEAMMLLRELIEARPRR
jgi:hypothetical protein